MVAAAPLTCAWAADDSTAATDGKGFAGLLHLFDVFTGHNAARHEAPAQTPAPAKPRVKVTKITTGRDTAKVGIEIPLDDPASAAKGDGAFIYLEGGSDVVDAADVGGKIPRVGGKTATTPADSLATRAAAYTGSPLGNFAVANPLAGGLRSGSIWSFTPRYAAAHFGITYLSGSSPSSAHQGFEVGVTSSLLRTDTSSGLEGAFLNAPLLGSGRRIYNLGLRLGYSGLSLGASLQHNEVDLIGSQTAYDVGLQYRRGAFSTSLQFSSGANQASKGILFRINPDSRVYAFEFGAAYRLRPGISFGGGLQYFNYNSVTLTPENDEAAVVFLGGNVNF